MTERDFLVRQDVRVFKTVTWLVSAKSFDEARQTVEDGCACEIYDDEEYEEYYEDVEEVECHNCGTDDPDECDCDSPLAEIGL